MLALVRSLVPFRRALAAGVAAALAFGVPALAATPAPATGVTRTVHDPVPGAGSYAVVVSLARVTAAETVTVTVGSQTMKNVSLNTSNGTALLFYPSVHSKTLVVKVRTSGAAVKFTVGAAKQTSAMATDWSGPPLASTGSTGSSGTTASQGTTGTTGTTGSSGATGTTGGTGATGVSGASGATGVTGNPIAPPRSFTARQGAASYSKLVWYDSFGGSSGAAPNPSNWSSDLTGGCGPGTLSTYTAAPANAALDGHGDLDVTARYAAGSYTGAQIDSRGHVAFKYGRIEARIEMPLGSGLCSGFWMVGNSGSATTACGPSCGEIDIVEEIGLYPAFAFGTLHGPISGSTNNQQWLRYVMSAVPLQGHWHTYGIIWSPNRITWTIDGVPYESATPSQLPASARWVFNTHTYDLLLSEVVGGWPGPPAGTSQFPATMRVAWVRVYD